MAVEVMTDEDLDSVAALGQGGFARSVADAVSQLAETEKTDQAVEVTAGEETPVDGEVTPAKADEERFTATDLDKLPEELKPLAKRLQADYHRKRQKESAEVRNLRQEAQGIEWAKAVMNLPPTEAGKWFRAAADMADQHAGITPAATGPDDQELEAELAASPAMRRLYQQQQDILQGLTQTRSDLGRISAGEQDRQLERAMNTLLEQHPEAEADVILATAEELKTPNLELAYLYAYRRENPSNSPRRGPRSESKVASVTKQVVSSLAGGSGGRVAAEEVSPKTFWDTVALAQKQIAQQR